MSMSESKPIKVLVEALVECASRRSFEVVRNPKQLSQIRTKSSLVLPALSDGADTASQLRPEMEKVVAPIGMFIKSHSSYAIHIGQLGGELVTGDWEEDYYKELISQWHGFQQYAAIARTWLLSDYSDDMNLFLVGPAGSKDEIEWQNFAQVVERNDLVCRKLLWLPGINDHEWETDLSGFLDRTFLSEPWKGEATTSGINLDALSSSMDGLDTWRDVLKRPEFRSEPIDHASLVKALLEVTSK